MGMFGLKAGCIVPSLECSSSACLCLRAACKIWFCKPAMNGFWAPGTACGGKKRILGRICARFGIEKGVGIEVSGGSFSEYLT